LNTLKVVMTTAALVAGLAFMAPAQEREHGRDRGFRDHGRGLIDRTQDDLRRAAEFERHRGKEVIRYENAQKHLSDFDREMTKGHFDKDRLDEAIDDVKNVVEHNTLDADDRDNLRRDLSDLRAMREEHDRS
jgi:hypothetical protein